MQPYCPSHTLTVVEAGFGSGAVTSSPAGIECGAKCEAPFQEGAAVTLTAEAASGSVFAGWSGGACHGTKPCVLTIAADTTVKATFRLKGESGGGGGAAEAIAHVTRRIVPVKAGTASLSLRCVGDTACHGALRLFTKIEVRKGKKRKRKPVLIAAAPFHLAAGATGSVDVKLTRRGQRMLKRRGRLSAQASGPGLVTSTVKLKRA